jgi:hypothetical protein
LFELNFSFALRLSGRPQGLRLRVRFADSSQSRAPHHTKCLTSTFPNNYGVLHNWSPSAFAYLIHQSRHLINPFINLLQGNSLPFLLDHTRNSSTDRTERPRFCIVPGGAGEEDGIDNSISGVCRHILRRFRGRFFSHSNKLYCKKRKESKV